MQSNCIHLPSNSSFSLATLFPSIASGDPGSHGVVREESEAGSEGSAQEGRVGGGRPATAGGTMMISQLGLQRIFMDIAHIFYFPMTPLQEVD